MKSPAETSGASTSSIHNLLSRPTRTLFGNWKTTATSIHNLGAGQILLTKEPMTHYYQAASE